jgi:hypothetical protein
VARFQTLSQFLIKWWQIVKIGQKMWQCCLYNVYSKLYIKKNKAIPLFFGEL